jgi:hypothetical protein
LSGYFPSATPKPASQPAEKSSHRRALAHPHHVAAGLRCRPVLELRRARFKSGSRTADCGEFISSPLPSSPRRSPSRPWTSSAHPLILRLPRSGCLRRGLSKGGPDDAERKDKTCNRRHEALHDEAFTSHQVSNGTRSAHAIVRNASSTKMCHDAARERTGCRHASACRFATEEARWFLARASTQAAVRQCCGARASR